MIRVRVTVVAALLVLLAGCDSTTAPAPTVARSSSLASSGAPASALPLRLPTGAARQVITVTAVSLTARTATLQAWAQRAGTWTRVGPPATANVGHDGLSVHETEFAATTPVGSFTLSQAFGRDPNPGTRLPFFQTTPDDWWISQPGPLYNTHQNCAANCAFATGTPNAQLYYVRPQYDLGVVIDYNRGPVVQGAGSGIFLHVSAGRPTNGCVSIPQADLVRIMRWLEPALHPRILIGVA